MFDKIASNRRVKTSLARLILALGALAFALSWDRGWWVVFGWFLFLVGVEGYDRLRGVPSYLTLERSNS